MYVCVCMCACVRQIYFAHCFVLSSYRYQFVYIFFYFWNWILFVDSSFVFRFCSWRKCLPVYACLVCMFVCLSSSLSVPVCPSSVFSPVPLSSSLIATSVCLFSSPLSFLSGHCLYLNTHPLKYVSFEWGRRGSYTTVLLLFGSWAVLFLLFLMYSSLCLCFQSWE